MESNEMDLPQTIYQLITEAVQAARNDYGVCLDFSPTSLRTLDKLLKRAHTLYASPGYAGKNPRRTVQVWGAYLGETLRRQHNGSWRENPAASEIRQYSVTTPAGNIFPMEQVFLRVVPGIRNPDLTAAPAEPPTRRIPSARRNWLIPGVLILAGMAIALVYVLARII